MNASMVSAPTQRMSLPTAAKHLEVSRWTLRNWAAEKRVNALWLGGRWKFTCEEVERLLVEGMPRTPKAA